MRLDPSIEEACRRLSGRTLLRLVLHGEAESDLALGLEQVAAAVSAAARGHVSIERSNAAAGPPLRPALTLCGPDRANIHYLAIPEGPEAAPFAAILEALGRGARSASPRVNVEAETATGGQARVAADRMPPAGLADLARLARPAELRVLVAAGCPSCPRAVAAAAALALASPLVSLAVIDAGRFAGEARRLEVRSVPVTLLDGELTLVGVRTTTELAEALLARDRPGFALRVLASLVESGRFVAAAERLCAAGGPADLAALWEQSTTATRIPLLLAVERALERRRDALDAAVPAITALLRSPEPALRGDSADLLGRIGHPAAAGPLAALLDDPHPDVAEIAAEALAQLRS